MDVRYKNIQTSSYTISIVFAGIYIADVSFINVTLYTVFTIYRIILISSGAFLN